MKRNLYLILLCIGFALIAQDASAQYYRNQGYWKKYRLQVIGGVGASNFLGELGGRDKIGSDFIWDLETKVFKPALTGGIRYHLSKKAAIRAQFSFATLSGDDALTKEPFRFNRNLHFRSRLYEFAAIYEYVIHKIRPGHRYNLAGVRGQKSQAAIFYLFGGVAGIYFNPQATFDDSWVDLKPLGTEGQNLRGGPEAYSLFSLAVPLGIGYRWRLSSEHIYIGFEIGHRFTFTDYIDDVSTEYFNSAALGDQPGFSPEQNLLAEYFGDPGLGYYLHEGAQIPLASTGEGLQRGDPTDNDGYLFVQATVSYALHKKLYKKSYSKAKKGKRIVF